MAAITGSTFFQSANKDIVHDLQARATKSMGIRRVSKVRRDPALALVHPVPWQASHLPKIAANQAASKDRAVIGNGLRARPEKG
jgi:hypothetical protein